MRCRELNNHEASIPDFCRGDEECRLSYWWVCGKSGEVALWLVLLKEIFKNDRLLPELFSFQDLTCLLRISIRNLTLTHLPLGIPLSNIAHDLLIREDAFRKRYVFCFCLSSPPPGIGPLCQSRNLPLDAQTCDSVVGHSITSIKHGHRALWKIGPRSQASLSP